MKQTINCWRFLALAVLVWAIAAVPTASAGSIWARATRTRQCVYADDTARNLGDSLTIIISEHSVVTTDAKRTNSKKTSRKAAMSGKINYGDLFSWLPTGDFAIPSVDVEGSYDGSFAGAGKWEDNRKIEDKVTVTVEDVLPNGNLVVLGQTRRTISGNEEIVQISGIVRPSDVAFDNTVSSERVADFYLVRRIEGPENRWTNPGWFGWLLNWLSPS